MLVGAAAPFFCCKGSIGRDIFKSSLLSAVVARCYLPCDPFVDGGNQHLVDLFCRNKFHCKLLPI